MVVVVTLFTSVNLYHMAIIGLPMGTQIRVSDDTWQRLNRRRMPGDTFEDVVQDLLSDAERRESDQADGSEQPAD